MSNSQPRANEKLGKKWFFGIISWIDQIANVEKDNQLNARGHGDT